MQLIVFEDDQVPRLHPITLGRPAYAIGCASFRLIDWLARLAADTGAARCGASSGRTWPPIQQLDFPQIGRRKPATETPALIVNARLVPTVGAWRRLRRLIDAGSTAAVYHDNQLAAAMIAPHGPAPPADADAGHWSKYLHNSIQGKLPTHDARLPLFVYPHDVIRYNLEIHRRVARAPSGQRPFPRGGRRRLCC